MTRKRTAVSAAFLCFGIVGGSLVPRMPAFKESLSLTDGQVGLAFLAYSLGAVAGSTLARPAMKWGARRLVRVGTLLIFAILLAPAAAPTFVVFAGSFLLLGISAGFIDVLENSQAAEIERESGRPMMNAFHGFWSLGFILGAVGAAAAASLGIAPLPHFVFVAVVVGGASIALLPDLPDTHGGAERLLPSGTAHWRIGTAVAGVAAIAFLGIVVESAGGDWGPIYVHDVGRAGLGLAAAAGVAFSLAMTAVRFSADRLTARTSPGVVAAVGSLVSMVGTGVAIGLPAPATAIAGFALVGAGSAVLVPLAFSAGANLGRTGTALTIVTGAGYAGSILGPFVIGSTADHLGLRSALAIPVFAAVAVMVTLVTLRPLGSRARTALVDRDDRGAAERS